MYAERLRRGRENAQILIDEHLDAEAAAQVAIDRAQEDLKVACAARATARRKARSEWLRWEGFDLPFPPWAEDRPVAANPPGIGGGEGVNCAE